MKISFKQFLSTRTFYKNLADGPATLSQGPAVWAGLSGYVYLDQLIAEQLTPIDGSYRPRAGEWCRDGMALDACETRLYTWACEHGLCDLSPAQARDVTAPSSPALLTGKLTTTGRALFLGDVYLGVVADDDAAAEVAHRFNAYADLLAAVGAVQVNGLDGPGMLKLNAAYQRAKRVPGTADSEFVKDFGEKMIAAAARGMARRGAEGGDDPDFFYWVTRLGVHRSWVADGFNLTSERADGMIRAAIPPCHGTEISAEVLAAPEARFIFEEQGYAGAELDQEVEKFQQEEARWKKAVQS